jgi:hypothetical protein
MMMPGIIIQPHPGVKAATGQKTGQLICSVLPATAKSVETGGSQLFGWLESLLKLANRPCFQRGFSRKWRV